MASISSKLVLFMLVLTMIKTATSTFPPGFEIPSAKATPLSKNSPNKPYSVCSKVWSVDSTICNPDRLMTYQQHDSTEVKTESTKTIEESTATQQIVNTLAAKNSYQYLARRLLPTATISAAETVSILQPFNDSRVMTLFKSQSDTCLTHMLKVRAAALCYICSNENAKYFANGKAVVSQADCGLMLNACLPFFKTASVLMESSSNYAKSLKERSASNWALGDSIIELNNQLKRANLPYLISQYETSTNASSKLQVGNQICARTFRLHKDPIFAAMENMVKQLNELLAMGGGRVLQLTTEGDPFVGDVTILQPTDNMFVSYDGTQGSTLANTVSSVPMNLSMIFP